MGFCSLLWKIGVLVICAILLLMCIPYIVLLVVQRNERDSNGKKKVTTETIVISVIAMVSLIITAIVGILAVFKRSRQLLLLWCVIMGVMFLFGIIQLILFFVNAGIIVPRNRDVSGKAQAIYLTATILIMIVALVGFIFGFLLRWRLVKKKSTSANYYE